MPGPLDGLRVVELAGQGPGPHASMLLADWGADVVRVVRRGFDGNPADIDGDAVLRNRTVVGADLKDPADVAQVLALIDAADILVEGYRPGVTERLGLDPEVCTDRNPRLIYARMTGWGQDGPRAHTAGHDINYLSVTGMLEAIGQPSRPTVPLNLIGDFAGGSMYLVCAALAALHERSTSGRGQVIDIAIIEGIGVVAHMVWAMRGMGLWREEREANILDGAAPYYRVYECEDGRFMAVGAVEQGFYDQLLTGLGLQREALPDRDDPSNWAALGDLLATRFMTGPRDYWSKVFENTDACTTPVLSMSEALSEQHLRSRQTFIDLGGVEQPSPAAPFSRSALSLPTPPGASTTSLSDVVDRWARNVDVSA